MNPLISVIIPARDAAVWIGATLRSVMDQTLSDWECIVVDDGSGDDTAARARAMGDPRIRVAEIPRSGVSAARNAGLARARGKLVAFLDADDIWLPRTLEVLSAPLAARPGIDLAWGDTLRFEDGTHRARPLPGTRLWQSGDAWADMLVDNIMPFGTFCVRAGLAREHSFDSSLRIGEDRDWLLRLLKGRTAVYLPHLVHFYRQRPGSAMRDVQRFLEDEERMMRPHLEAPDVPAGLRRRARSALAFHRAVLLARIPGRRMEAIAHYLSALSMDPLYCENYLRPLRKLWTALGPTRYVRLPEPGLFEDGR